MRFIRLKTLADLCDCVVEKTKRGEYEWWRKSNPGLIGVCSTIQECYEEIWWEVYKPLIFGNHNP